MGWAQDSIKGFVSWALVLPSGWSRWSLVEGLFVCDPVLFGVVQRVDHLRNQFVGLGDLEHRTCVLVPSAVVSGREHSEKATSCKPLEAIHHALVCS